MYAQDVIIVLDVILSKAKDLLFASVSSRLQENRTASPGMVMRSHQREVYKGRL
jgi:hypothetical protein